MKLPPEEVLEYIESQRGLLISRGAYLSEEYYNPHHMEGKYFPAFYANNGLRNGTQTKLVELEGINYVVQSSMKATAAPIPILRSGRTPKTLKNDE